MRESSGNKCCQIITCLTSSVVFPSHKNAGLAFIHKWVKEKKKLYQWYLIEYLNKTSLVVQCIRICPPVQTTWVRSLVQEDPTCYRAAKLVHHNYGDHALQLQILKSARPRAHMSQPLSQHAAPSEACVPRACALQQEKPLQWEAHALQQRAGPCTHHIWRKPAQKQWRSSAVKAK